MQKKIRIITTPPGQAPEEVRAASIGLELSVIDDSVHGIQVGVLGGKPENIGGYTVSGKEFIEILNAKDSMVANWWKENVPQILSVNLVFKKEVCELI